MGNNTFKVMIQIYQSQDDETDYYETTQPEGIEDLQFERDINDLDQRYDDRLHHDTDTGESDDDDMCTNNKPPPSSFEKSTENCLENMYRVFTLAGDGTPNTKEGKGKEARVNWPYEIKFTKNGDGIFTAYGSASVRKISTDGTITTLLHRPNSSEYFSCPRGLALDRDENVYIADSGNNVIRKISPDGICTKINTDAHLSSPYGIAIDNEGNIFVSDTYRNCIKTLSKDGKYRIFAGTENYRGHVDAVGTEARFFSPQGIDFDQYGNLIVADSGNARIRKISPDGCVTTIAGGAGEFLQPYGVALDKSGNIFVADYGNNRIRRINKKGEIHTVAGSGSVYEEEPRHMSMPTGLAVDHKGNIIVCDCYNHVIRKVTCILEDMALSWPNSHFDLPSDCQQAIKEVVCVLSVCPPMYLPKELVALVTKVMISCWPV